MDIGGHAGVVVGITPLQTLLEQDDRTLAIPDQVFLDESAGCEPVDRCRAVARSALPAGVSCVTLWGAIVSGSLFSEVALMPNGGATSTPKEMYPP